MMDQRRPLVARRTSRRRKCPSREGGTVNNDRHVKDGCMAQAGDAG